MNSPVQSKTTPSLTLLVWCLIGGLICKLMISIFFLNPKGIRGCLGLTTSHAATTTCQSISAASPLPRLLNMIQEERQALRAREEALRKRESQLLTLKQDLESRLQELAALQEQVTRLVAKQRQIKEERQRHLIVTLASMPPERAGKLLEQMEEESVAHLLRSMKGKEAGKILGLLEPAKAARIGKCLFD